MGEIEITVINKLNAEKRDMNVHHHSNRSAYIISHNMRMGTDEKIAQN